jgi:hypothetical protein
MTLLHNSGTSDPGSILIEPHELAHFSNSCEPEHLFVNPRSLEQHIEKTSGHEVPRAIPTLLLPFFQTFNWRQASPGRIAKPPLSNQLTARIAQKLLNKPSVVILNRQSTHDWHLAHAL